MTGHAQFEQRCEGLIRKHSELARGFTVKVGDDGLIEIAPKREHSRMRIRIILAAIIGFFAFKAVTIATLPPQTYLDRIAGLRDGTVFERAAGWAMHPDPVTLAIVDVAKSVLGF